MTRKLTSIAVLVLLVSAATAQTARTSSGRVDQDGPYQSKVRLLEESQPPEVSAEELLQSSQQNAYGRALIMRQLAQRGIATGDTGSAIDYYEQALALDSLSPLAASQMQVNLGQLYALANRHAEAVRLLEAALTTAGDESSAPDPNLLMSLATSYLQLNRPGDAARHAAAAIGRAGATVATEWLRFVVAAYWKAGEPGAATMWQLRLLDETPDETASWTQLAALYRESGDDARALATLETAALSGLLVDESDWLRLIQMHLDYGTPAIAAQLLKPLVGQRPDAQHWQWLAQILLRSGDEVAALGAMQHWAQADTNPAAWLEVGELAAMLGDRDDAIDALQRAATNRADGSVRGRALLLLGQLEVERGNTRAAQRALTEASEYGGVYRSASEWLEFLQTMRSTTEKTESGTGPDTALTSAATAVPTPQTPLAIKTVPRQRVYTANRATSAAALTDTALDLVQRLTRATRRERLEWMGPLHIVVNGDISDPSRAVDVSVAAPIRRVAPPRGEFSSGSLDVFRCAWQRYEGPWEGLEQAWRSLYQQAVAAGLQPTREA
ncbi:MAG: tetratricopeptide repeat protein, partial [Gammaproteobacteria bacterium]|nr:tetratricopeptide repeat protein [Gammaproteobacteria bacterium]